MEDHHGSDGEGVLRFVLHFLSQLICVCVPLYVHVGVPHVLHRTIGFGMHGRRRRFSLACGKLFLR